MKKGTYAGEYEIIMACLEFRSNIIIYKRNDEESNEDIYTLTYETISSYRTI